jgi:EAL domain-containing protein (putative c-di-GMP-specific phosphodiesterase class I)
MISTHVSAGVATSRHSGSLTADLLRDADVAMYEAKSEGKGRYAMFTPEMRETVLRRHIVKEELRAGIEEERLLVQYQPIIDIRSGELSAVEALVRWEHPDRGRIPPLEFVPLAEMTGLIVPLGRYVLRRSCEQIVKWQRASGRALSVQVNLSARELDSPDLIPTVAEVLETTGLDPRHLILEITETVMIRDAASGGATLDGLRELGVRLALDDFGTGYSSLSYLRTLPLSYLKIAKEFVDGLAQSEEDLAFVRLIIELARMRELQVIAEGIEDAEQLNILRSLGCDHCQGYYFAKPLDADDPDLLAALAPIDPLAATGDRPMSEGPGVAAVRTPSATLT